MVALTAIGCGGGAHFASAAKECGLEVHGLGAGAATCFASSSVRILALRVDASGAPIVVGSFHGRLELDRSHPIASDAVAQPFVAKLGADLQPRFVVPLDTPVDVRGVVTGRRGIAIVSSSTEAPAGPFLTRLGPDGAVTLRKDLAFGGVVSGAAFDPRGGVVTRTQQDGLRMFVTDEDGKVLVAPPWLHEFPTSLREGALTPDVAVLGDGLVTAHTRAPLEDGGPSDQALSKISPTGVVIWTKPAAIGRSAQLASAGAGIAALTPDARSLCAGQAVAVTFLDGEANVRWSRCFTGKTTALRLATDTSGRIVVVGQAEGPVDLGEGPITAPGNVASFVLRLDTDGNTKRLAWLGGPRNVANQAVALMPGGKVLVAGVISQGPRQTHVYIATREE